MKEIILSSNVCAFSDDNEETLNIQIELPGVDKKDIELQFFNDDSIGGKERWN